MSGRFSSFHLQKNRFKFPVTRRGFRRKEAIAFIPFLFILFVAMTFIFPFLHNLSPTVLGRRVVGIISLPLQGELDLSLLLNYSIPGMSFKRDTSPLFEEKEAGKITDGQTPLQLFPRYLLNSELAGFNSQEKHGISFVPVHDSIPKENISKAEPGPGEIDDFSMVASPEKLSLANAASSIKEKGPLILIYHTHTTESFVPFSGEAFSTNLEKTVVVLGEYLKEILEKKYGIPVLHYCEVFDIPRRSAYEKARPAVEKIIAEHPGIQVVLDVHRDGVSRNTTTVSVNGSETGRVLFVLGSNHKDWNNNLRFALFLQEALEEISPGLSRGIRKQPFTYNQHLHHRSLIVEIGGHENSMEEVKRTIPYLAGALAAVLQ